MLTFVWKWTVCQPSTRISTSTCHFLSGPKPRPSFKTPIVSSGVTNEPWNAEIIDSKKLITFDIFQTVFLLIFWTFFVSKHITGQNLFEKSSLLVIIYHRLLVPENSQFICQHSGVYSTWGWKRHQQLLKQSAQSIKKKFLCRIAILRSFPLSPSCIGL